MGLEPGKGQQLHTPTPPHPPSLVSPYVRIKGNVQNIAELKKNTQHKYPICLVVCLREAIKAHVMQLFTTNYSPICMTHLGTSSECSCPSVSFIFSKFPPPQSILATPSSPPLSITELTNHPSHLKPITSSPIPMFHNFHSKPPPFFILKYNNITI